MIDYFNVKRADQLAAEVGVHGCAKHNDPSCLCDVVVHSASAVKYVPAWFDNCTDVDAFITSAELMLGRMELVDMERVAKAITHGGRVNGAMQAEVIAAVWEAHADPEITQRQVAQMVGCTQRNVGSTAEALGLKWVSKKRRNDGRLAPAREMYLRLREAGHPHALSRNVTMAKTKIDFKDQTARNWWTERNRRVREAAAV